MGEFSDYLAALRAARAHRPLMAGELGRLRDLWQAAEDSYHDPEVEQAALELARTHGAFSVPSRPPSWELLDVELGPPEASPEKAPVEPRGKDYPGDLVEDVVRRATAAEREGRRLARTLRDELAKQTGATVYAVDAIFRLMKRELLADTGRKGWLKLDDQVSATPAFVNLHELETRS